MPTVVIADDSSTARMIIRRCLEIAGCTDCKIYEADNGQKALEILRQEQVNLLITDLNMPVMDGEHLLKTVKASPRLNDITVMVISSLANHAKEKELLDWGATKVIIKPIDPGKIASALEHFFGQEFHL